MAKMIDADKLLEWLNSNVDAIQRWNGRVYESIAEQIEEGTFDPTPPVQPNTPQVGDTVKHRTYGIGKVMGHSDRRYVNVQFPDCYTECWTEGLEVIK